MVYSQNGSLPLLLYLPILWAKRGYKRTPNIAKDKNREFYRSTDKKARFFRTTASAFLQLS